MEKKLEKAQRFRIKKFVYAFLADNAAMIVHPLCTIEWLVQRWQGGVVYILYNSIYIYM